MSMKAPQYRQRPPPPADPEWDRKVGFLRFHVMRTIGNIRAGAVEEEDLDKLNNYVLQSLALVERSGAKAWAAAQLRAEYVSLIDESSTKRIDREIS